MTLFMKLEVSLSLDSSNVQHEKLVLKLVEPKIPGFSVEAQGDETEAKKRKNGDDKSEVKKKKKKANK